MKKLQKRFLPALAVSLIALLVVELALRALGYSALHWHRPDALLGWSLRPGLNGWFTNEGRGYVRINSAGQRDREHDFEKPPQVYRIAVLGDAYSEAMQVSAHDAYWALLPEKLERCGFRPGKRIEALNFGVRDYGTAQAYLVLQHLALRYRPDLVLLQFSHGNDVRDNSYALDRVRGRPYFRLDGEGRLVLDASFLSEGRYASRASPARELFVSAVNEVRMLQLARKAGVSAVTTAHAGETGNEAGLEIHTLAPPRDAQWSEAWRVTEALIARIGELAALHGAASAVVVVPFGLEGHPDRALRERLLAKYGVADFAYPDRRVASFARERGMHAILLAPEFQMIAAATGRALYGDEGTEPGFGHFNERGHRAAAELIARSLCANPSW